MLFNVNYIYFFPAALVEDEGQGRRGPIPSMRTVAPAGVPR